VDFCWVDARQNIVSRSDSEKGALGAVILVLVADVDEVDLVDVRSVEGSALEFHGYVHGFVEVVINKDVQDKACSYSFFRKSNDEMVNAVMLKGEKCYCGCENKEEVE